MSLPAAALVLPPEYLKHSTIVPKREYLLDRVPKGGVVAEVGVALGGFTYHIFDRCKPTKFYSLDIFNLHTLPEFWGKPSREVFGDLTHRAFYEKEFAWAIESGQMEVKEGDSVASLETFADRSLDMIYVDAHHSYDAVSKELAVIKHKIKDTGIIIMNDYTFLENVGSKAEYGVIQATHEFMIAEGWEMRALALERYMFCDVLLTKIQPGGSPLPLQA
jgi:hypothetical protein